MMSTSVFKNKLYTFRYWNISDNECDYCYKSIILANDVEDAYYTFYFKVKEDLKYHRGLYRFFEIPDIDVFEEYYFEIPNITFNYTSQVLYIFLTVDSECIYEFTNYNYTLTENDIHKILRYKFTPIDNNELENLLSK